MENKFENAKMYCILNSIDDAVYVGSTCQTLSQRMTKHRHNTKSRPNSMKLTQKMQEQGIEHFYIELLEEYPCENKDQLMKKEGEWIRKIATLNEKVQGRTEAEWRKTWREENKDEYLKKRKEHREKNIDKLREQDRARYHKKTAEERTALYEKAKEWKATKHVCECGRTYTNAHKAEHIKSKFHQTYLSTMV